MTSYSETIPFKTIIIKSFLIGKLLVGMTNCRAMFRSKKYRVMIQRNSQVYWLEKRTKKRNGWKASEFDWLELSGVFSGYEPTRIYSDNTVATRRAYNELIRSWTNSFGWFINCLFWYHVHHTWNNNSMHSGTILGHVESPPLVDPSETIENTLARW